MLLWKFSTSGPNVVDESRIPQKLIPLGSAEILIEKQMNSAFVLMKDLRAKIINRSTAWRHGTVFANFNLFPVHWFSVVSIGLETVNSSAYMHGNKSKELGTFWAYLMLQW